ncbi:MAG: calcineurin-like phosphoesterase C-terminal domain-containing protein, partial [Muribaculaceae bacterium]
VISVFSNNNYPVRLFAVMGNHDNDGATPESEDTDFLSTAYWRKYIAPNYYSYNIGKIHYVVLDDIFYKNTDTGESYRTGIVGSRDYDCTLINDVIEWLKKDLSYVSHDTPVILELHAPAFKLNTTTATNFSPYTALANSSTEALCEIVKDYKKVHIWSGHLHYNYHAFPEEYPNIHENNIAAICAIWWKSGYLCGRHICADGTPGGYEVYYMDGDSIRWQYHSLEDNGNAQFRVYDSNALIDYYNTNQSIKEILEEKPKKKNWGNTDPDNLFVNVFNYDPSWKIEAYENGELVNMSHVYTEDPLHQATFNVPYHETYPSDVSGITTNKTSHFFKIKPKSGTTPIDFRITDRFGNIYTKTVTRPLAFDIQELDSNDAEMATVIETKIEDGARISTYGNIICIDSDCSCKAVIAMVNGSYNLIDVNPGHNEYNMPAAGFYIVKVGNKASKVLLR